VFSRFYPRKIIDIRFRHYLGILLFGWLVPERWRRHFEKKINNRFSNKNALVFHSVRSGYDAYLAAMKFPKGSEVVMTGVTIQDMVDISRHHGLVVRAVDLDLLNFKIKPACLAKTISRKTKLIVATHAYGAILDMAPIFNAIAKRRDIRVVEDCAQIFAGVDAYLGDARSDLSLFSFGAIKTMTVLGGALGFARDEDIASKVARLQDSYPPMTKPAYYKRTLQVLFFTQLMFTYTFPILVALCNLFKLDYDAIIIKNGRSFAGGDFYKKIRKKPSIILLALLNLRLGDKSISKRIAARQHAFDLLRKYLGEPHGVHAFNAASNTNWVTVISVDRPDEFVAELVSRRVDATYRASQMVAVIPDGKSARAIECEKNMRNLIYIPILAQMPESKIAEVAEVIKRYR